MGKVAPLQRAELRVTLEGARGCALVMFVEVRGDDIYAGNDRASSARRFRTSYHASGQRHTYTAVGRFARRRDTPPASIRGFRDIYQTTTATQDWTYTPKPDTGRKRTLRLRDEDYPDGACVMAVAIEPGRADLVAGFQSQATFDNLKVDLCASLVADWVSPTIVISILRMRPEVVQVIRNQAVRDGGDPSEKMTGFIVGPPARHGIEWSVLGKVAANGTVTRFAPEDS